ncbi:hypothetical protein JM83_1696 [Gillisia sp. Hel_I_86]|uniref:toll/interleukin-1 receptor domain-containing protein n=1 Tax=Gillisia sp. Hel_I_86 TaxID=1249981 RepID=UPI00119BF317|nr:toll/interleukin-1 receptor domain-containing protein [Gillisia sp. Hel_I_86]TVZ26709.1 hypothetical protein JM83_1696 [Gillisia sp. Hel_I_86]
MLEKNNPQARDTIFIGHATPEDNEFTIWLQSQLQNHGYNCECDLTFLLGGESDYWKSLQDFLEYRSIKYILVVSEVTFSKQGVLDEWEQCKSIERQFGLKDFIIPIKIDQSSYSARIGLNRKNIIDFEKNWAVGLKRLFKKLEADKAPRDKNLKTNLTDWYNNIYSNWSGIEKGGTDVFYSNWLRIENLPRNIYFFHFRNDKQAKAILKENDFPCYRHGNMVVTFDKDLNLYLEAEDLHLNPKEVIETNTKNAFNYFESDNFPKYNDLRRLLVRLLNRVLHYYMENLGLLHYQFSNKLCYFHPHSIDDKVKGKFELNGKSKNIGLTGKYFEDFWHYGISFHTLLEPELCFSLKNHLVFTSDGMKPWSDSKKIQAARRKKGKRMFNKEWRDLLLSYLSILGTEENKIYIPLSNNSYLELPTTPILFESSFTYIEPNDEKRMIPIDDFLEEQEHYLSQDEESQNE